MQRARVPLLLAGALALAAPALAQTAKLGKKHFTDEQNGYRFVYPNEWSVVPVAPDDLARGTICRMDGPDEITKVESGDRLRVDTSLVVLELRDDATRTAAVEGDRSTAEVLVRRDVGDVIDGLYHLEGFDPEKPDLDEQVGIKKLSARHRRWSASTSAYRIVFDTWTFPFPEREADIALVFNVAEANGDKWLKVFERSAKTFEAIDVVERSTAAGKTYEDQLAYHADEASRTPGWRALPTPSKKFIVKTSSENRKFIDEVIERLESSRELFEQDFPPTEAFDHVSVVRICATEAEFHSYGGTGGGVAGWFNPSTTELVLYDAVETDRNASYAVMSHEAFHQYCHFLFGQSEAHRWFDEGHGDYYGGVKFGRKAEVTPHMPGGLDRYPVIKEMVREGTYAPLEKHLNSSHGEWQNQGPSNVSCYGQSWSIIYMLRQGTLGKVPRKYWKDEYAEIIPSYVATLNAGFREAYDALRKSALDRAKAAGREPTPDELDFDRSDIPPSRKEEIWRKAMDASWGAIDLAQFEENWLGYIAKEL